MANKKTESIEVVNKELKDTKKALYDTLNDKLGNIEVTKKELETLKKQLKEAGADEQTIEKELNRFPINKKLYFILKEIDIHGQLQDAINFLDTAIEIITNDGQVQ